MTEIIAKLKSGSGGVILQREKGGLTDSKEVDLAEFAAEINQGSEIKPGWFPPNTRNWSSAGTNRIVAVELPAGKRDVQTIKMSNRSGEQVLVKGCALPAALFIFIMRQEGAKFHMLNAHLFAMENDRIISPMRDRLFHYPTPNVYTTTDKITQICWGPNIDPMVPSLLGIEGMILTFMSSVFNTDLFGSDKTSDLFPWNKMGNYLNVDEYFGLLSEEPVFKSEWLKPAPDQFSTVDKAFSSILSKCK